MYTITNDSHNVSDETKKTFPVNVSVEDYYGTKSSLSVDYTVIYTQ